MGIFIEPFDFQTIFVNYFLGGLELFIFAFIIVVSMMAASFRLTNRIFMILLTIGSVIFAGILGEAVYILVILIIGLITFKGIGKLVQ